MTSTISAPHSLMISPMIDNRELALQWVSRNGWSLQRVSRTLQEDRKIVLHAVSHIGEALQFAPLFNNDPEITTIALAQNGANLEFCSSTMRDNEDIVKKAIHNNLYSITFASLRLQDSSSLAFLILSSPRYREGFYISKMSARIQRIYNEYGREGIRIDSYRAYLEETTPNKSHQEQCKI